MTPLRVIAAVYIIVGTLYLAAWIAYLRHDEPPEE